MEKKIQTLLNRVNLLSLRQKISHRNFTEKQNADIRIKGVHCFYLWLKISFINVIIFLLK